MARRAGLHGGCAAHGRGERLSGERGGGGGDAGHARAVPDLLERLGQRLAPARWRTLLGDAFGPLRACLRRTGAPVRFVACPGCGCNHKVFRDDADGRFYAVCTCPACDCDDIPLDPQEAEAWELDPLLFGREVQSALGTQGRLEPAGENVLDLGCCPRHGGGGHALLLFGSAADAVRAVPGLAARKSVGCVLTSPAPHGAERLLAACGIPSLRLGEVCEPAAGGWRAACGGACGRLPRDLSNREAVEAVVERLEAPVRGLAREAAAEGAEELARMATDPAGAVARIAAGFGDGASRDLFHLLIHTEERDGRKRGLSYAEIGARLGGITKQAVEQKVRRFRRAYPKPWGFVASVRKPPKTRRFSELGPKARRQTGVGEEYGYGEAGRG